MKALGPLYRVALAVILLDQFTKWLVVQFLDLKTRGVIMVVADASALLRAPAP